jgi:Uma2 family endonuclease
MSVDEFLDLPEPDDKPKLELDDGELYVMPRPRRVHQFLTLKMGTYLVNFLDSFTEPPAEVYFELVTILSREPRRVLVPDLCIFLREHTDIFVRGYAEGPPDIVIEILSSDRNRDLVRKRQLRKRQLYAEAGVPEYWSTLNPVFDYDVPEYWIIDSRNDTVTPLELQGGQYVERGILTSDGTLTTPLLPGLDIPLADLFHHRQRPRDDE